MMENEATFIAELLYKQFGSILLSKSQTSKILGISICNLDRLRKQSLGVPFFKENNSNVYYSITDIAQHVVDKKIQTTSISIYTH